MTEEAEQAERQETLSDTESLISNLSRFSNNEDLSDVELRVGEDSYHAHRLVLAVSSDVFRTMLFASQWGAGDSEERRVVALQESAECQRVFGLFLRFLYTGRAELSVGVAVGVLCLADKYNVASLRALVVEYMERHARSPHFGNAMAWYSWAKLLNLDSLTSVCFKSICWNVERIVEREEWLRLDAQFVEDVARSSELLVTDEFVLYRALVAWLTQPSRADQLEANAQRLLPHVRFPMMAVNQLFLIEGGRDFQAWPAAAELVASMLSLAYRFRALCPAQRELQLAFTEARYCPRDYKALSVDNLRMGNTLRFGFQVDVRMYVGAVPSASRDGEWKLTYRKNGNNWSIHVYCHETALVDNEAHVQLTVVVYGEQEQVIDVVRAPPHTCARGSHQQFSFDLGAHNDDARMLLVLLKPLPGPSEPA